MPRSDARINIVSGGHAVCLTCSTRLADVPATCPVCGTPLVSGSFRLVRAAETAAHRRTLEHVRGVRPRP
jgi:predicted amidophosphoribosyltransferase